MDTDFGGRYCYDCDLELASTTTKGKDGYEIEVCYKCKNKLEAPVKTKTRKSSQGRSVNSRRS